MAVSRAVSPSSFNLDRSPCLTAGGNRLRAERKIGGLLSEPVGQGSKGNSALHLPKGIGRMDSSRWQREERCHAVIFQHPTAGRVWQCERWAHCA